MRTKNDTGTRCGYRVSSQSSAISQQRSECQTVNNSATPHAPVTSWRRLGTLAISGFVFLVISWFYGPYSEGSRWCRECGESGTYRSFCYIPLWDYLSENSLSRWAKPHVRQPHEHELMGSGSSRSFWFGSVMYGCSLSSDLARLREYEREHGVEAARPLVDRYFELIAKDDEESHFKLTMEVRTELYPELKERLGL